MKKSFIYATAFIAAFFFPANRITLAAAVEIRSEVKLLQKIPVSSKRFPRIMSVGMSTAP